MEFWKQIYDRLNTGKELVLLYVLHSEGSSPGRQGFKMAVDGDNWMIGSIGGGFMEHKLVELSKSLLEKGFFEPFIKNQIHRTNEVKDRSGMICSGQQTVAFYHLSTKDINLVKQIINSDGVQCSIRLSENGISLLEHKGVVDEKFSSEVIAEHKWEFIEILDHKTKITIIGAGHVGLALSSLMKQLGFYIHLIDDRVNLNTMDANEDADKKSIGAYENIDDLINDDPDQFIALMSFGFRSDKLIIKKLIAKKYKYFGVLGSQSKMDKLLDELKSEIDDPQKLDSLYTPIGIQIHSKTPMEIAVSIAAEIIKIKNGS